MLNELGIHPCLCIHPWGSGEDRVQESTISLGQVLAEKCMQVVL